jgi:hypothetical protein
MEKAQVVVARQPRHSEHFDSDFVQKKAPNIVDTIESHWQIYMMGCAIEYHKHSMIIIV